MSDTYCKCGATAKRIETSSKYSTDTEVRLICNGYGCQFESKMLVPKVQAPQSEIDRYLVAKDEHLKVEAGDTTPITFMPSEKILNIYAGSYINPGLRFSFDSLFEKDIAPSPPLENLIAHWQPEDLHDHVVIKGQVRTIEDTIALGVSTELKKGDKFEVLGPPDRNNHCEAFIVQGNPRLMGAKYYFPHSFVLGCPLDKPLDEKVSVAPKKGQLRKFENVDLLPAWVNSGDYFLLLGCYSEDNHKEWMVRAVTGDAGATFTVNDNAVITVSEDDPLGSEPESTPDAAMLISIRSDHWGPDNIPMPGREYHLSVCHQAGYQPLFADRILISAEVFDAFTVRMTSIDRVFQLKFPASRLVDVAGKPHYEIIFPKKHELHPGCEWFMVVVNDTKEPKHFEAVLSLIEDPGDYLAEKLGEANLTIERFDRSNKQLAQRISDKDKDLSRWKKGHREILMIANERAIGLNDLQARMSIVQEAHDSRVDHIFEQGQRIKELEDQLSERALAFRDSPLSTLDEMSFGGTVLEHKERFRK